jgi:hypothetical protein
MSFDEYKKLAGITRAHANETWRLTEAQSVSVGARVKAADDVGIDSGKRGVVLAVEGDWVQLRTASGETLKLPTRKVTLEAAAQVESKDKSDLPAKLQAHARTLVAVSKELAQNTETPLEFYSEVSSLISAIADMLAKVSGDKEEAASLVDVAEKLSAIGSASRHSNTWRSVPTA